LQESWLQASVEQKTNVCRDKKAHQMQTFKQFTQSNKKFVGLFFSEETNTQLKQWAVGNGFDLSKSYSGEDQDPDDFDFHTTIFFTTNEHMTPVGEYFIEPISLKAESMGILGADKQIPVIHVELHTKLEAIRNLYFASGYRDAWPDYKPHISASYSYNGTPSLPAVKLPDFDIVANRIVISNQTS
jgi:hypothetical protein